MKAYLLSLKNLDGVNTYKTQRKMCIMVFCKTINSIIDISKELLNEQPFAMTYRFSQDAMEPYFNYVRRSGNMGNVSSFETEKLLSNIIFGADFDDNVFVEHASLQYIVRNCTAYMAGWVVKSITPTISCAECRKFLISASRNISSESSNHFIILKDNGQSLKRSIKSKMIHLFIFW
ncbi:hypothetical protein HELRODRAFT_164060 [Helobdella robusta]|uniref:Transposable element P transposase n=1 Tax=Helobdella robusta TaxID=6412 RepID=T1EUU8_HELRO|nr:hypothetical protein HELRODRAFT_164060 [Helobdella robusta]ESN94254.1 hypothetical protein HELRODRAFT_164060 [Helobdella robusta]